MLDFFGGMFEIRNGMAVIPGGQRSAGAWAELAGASPDHGAEFFDKLISKDDGWLASLYDALGAHSRSGAGLPHRTRAHEALLYRHPRQVTSPGPARPVFRSNADMMLLTTRLRIEPDGQPHIPGELEVWKDLFARAIRKASTTPS